MHRLGDQLPICFRWPDIIENGGRGHVRPYADDDDTYLAATVKQFMIVKTYIH